MNTGAYLAALDRKLRELAGIIVSSSIQREVDANLSVEFTKGASYLLTVRPSSSPSSSPQNVASFVFNTWMRI